MAWHYVIDGVSHGPVAETEMRTLRQQNVVTPDTPVWTDGMSEWVPLANSTLARAGSPPAYTGSPPAYTQACTECGKVFPADEMLQYENARVCAACKPLFFQRLREGVAPPGTLIYASVGRRFLALMIDGFIVMGLIVLVVVMPFLIVASWIIGPNHETVSQQGWVIALMMIFVYGMPPLYEIIMVGKYGATCGKMALGIKVVRPDGGRVFYGRSTGRYFAKILSGMIFYIGYLMAFWDKEKRALHDQICQTRVIKTGLR